MKTYTRRFSRFTTILIFTIMALVLASAFATTALAVETQSIYTAKATATVNVRSEPSTKSTKLGKLKKGDTVTYLGAYEDGWMRVLYNGETAYVFSEYASVLPTSEDEYRVSATDENGIKVELILNNSTFTTKDIIYPRAEVSYAGKKSKQKISGSTDMVLALVQGDTVIIGPGKLDLMDCTLKRNKPMMFNTDRNMSFALGETLSKLQTSFWADDFKLPAGEYELQTSFSYYMPKLNDGFTVTVTAPIVVTK